MNIRHWMVIFSVALAITAWAADPLTELLQKGLFEEEANHDLNAAIQSYQSVVSQADQQRKLAATAVYRLGECYRKLGRTNESIAQYQRVLRDFADQTNLVTLSEQNLVGLGLQITSREAGLDARAGAPTSTLATSLDSRLEQKRLLQEEIKLAELQLEILKRQIEVGRAPQENSLAKEREILALRRQLAALDIGPATAADAATVEAGTTDDEQKEIRRIQALIQNSPDLIDKPGTNNLTPLQQAAASGYPQVARFLLAHQAKVNSAITIASGRSPANEVTALHIAAYNGNKAMVELLLDHGAEVNAVGRWQGTTGSALHFAAKQGYQAVAEVLLAHQAGVNLSPDGGGTPLAVAAASGNPALAKLLLEHGADANATNLAGWTPMHCAAQANSPAVAELLLSQKAGVDAKAKDGATPLAVAVSFRRTKVAEFLLNNGADVEAKDESEFTPLQKAVTRVMFAGYGAQPELVRLLLKMGADPNRPFNVTGSARWLKGQTGGTGLDLTGSTPLVAASYLGDVAVVEALLAGGADVNIKSSEGVTPLLYVVYHKSIQMLDAILAHKPDTEVRTHGGLTALALAIESGEKRMAEKLIQAGADVNAEWSAGGNGSLLHQAVLIGNNDLIELLLTNKANVNVINQRGQTPLDLANEMVADARITKHAAEIATLLQKHGAVKDFTRRSYISVGRGERGFRARVFTKGTNDWNRYTLLELIATVYANRLNEPANRLPFPDLSRVTINRLGTKGEPGRSFTVDVAVMLSSGDSTNAPWLDWGDLIEIPELDHPVNQEWYGLTQPMTGALQKCLRREVSIVIKERNTKVILAPDFQSQTPIPTIMRPLETVQLPPRSGPDANPEPIHLNVFRLKEVVRGSGLLRVSSDLTRVRVTRPDPVTRKPVEWIVNLSSDPSYNPQIDLWLRDGDVIEVPEK